MRRVVTTASSMAMACAFAVTLAAQSGTTPSGTQPGNPPTQDPATSSPGTTGTAGSWDPSMTPSKNITLTGCLQGTTGAWTLTHAMMGSGSASSATSGTTGSSSSTSTDTTGSSASTDTPSSSSMSGTAAAGTTYKLISNDSDKLSKHVGKKVQVTGTLDSSSASSMGTSGSSTATTPDSSSATGSTSGTTGSASSMTSPSVRVQSVREISGTCTQ
jgi:hypothetical protein